MRWFEEVQCKDDANSIKHCTIKAQGIRQRAVWEKHDWDYDIKRHGLFSSVPKKMNRFEKSREKVRWQPDNRGSPGKWPLQWCVCACVSCSTVSPVRHGTRCQGADKNAGHVCCGGKFNEEIPAADQVKLNTKQTHYFAVCTQTTSCTIISHKWLMTSHQRQMKLKDCITRCLSRYFSV